MPHERRKPRLDCPDAAHSRIQRKARSHEATKARRSAIFTKGGFDDCPVVNFVNLVVNFVNLVVNPIVNPVEFFREATPLTARASRLPTHAFPSPIATCYPPFVS